MATLNRPRIFEPHELRIIERAYETAWAEIVTRNPNRDSSKDEERKIGLRKRVFATAEKGIHNADGLCDKVLIGLPKQWLHEP